MTSKEREDSRFKRYCCVYGCMNKGNKGTELSFFNLPKEIDRRREWLIAAQREDLLDETNLKKPKNSFVCAEHFDDSAITIATQKRLKSDAVPTKSLPNQDGHSVAPDLNKAVKSKPSKALPGSSRDLPPDSSNKEDVSIFIYSRTNAQSKPRGTEAEYEIGKETEKIKIKPKTACTATQTDLNETTDQMTQTTFTFCEKPPRKRGLEEEAEIVTRKRRRHKST